MTQPNPQPAAKSDNTYWVYLSYFLGWILALIGLSTVKDDDRIRFHCAQALVLTGAVTIAAIVLGIVGGMFILFAWFLFALFNALLWLCVVAYYVLAILIAVQFSQGKDFRVPIAADFAEKNVMNLFK